MSKTSSYSLFNNSRFYILVSSVLVSLIVVTWTRIAISNDQLFYIRTQQFYGLICIFYWYIALAISPVGYMVGKKRMKHIEFARRAIGVSAAYFAILHATVAFWGQLGGFGGLATLPTLFQWSLAAGLVGVIVLSILAATSFDKVITYMTFPRWKWLHRLVYAGGILAVLHIWSLGTHIGYGSIELLAFVALIILSGLEMFRVVTLLARKYSLLAPKHYFYTLFILLWVIWIGLIGSIPLVVSNYRDSSDSHAEHTGSSHAESHHE